MRFMTRNNLFYLGVVLSIVLSTSVLYGYCYDDIRVPYTHRAEKEYQSIYPRDALQRPSQILKRHSYVVSYNYQRKCPNWVFWKLTREHADGKVKRPDYAFHEDMEVPAPRAELSDYRGSGYDRGHMCPAGDNKWNADVMYESFLLSNVCPQDKQLNSGVWNQIEIKCRYWAKKYGSLYIVCGPVYLGKENRYIGTNRVSVPDAFFKVVLCLNERRGIGFICLNSAGKWSDVCHVYSIREIERITGYTFFPCLPFDIAQQVKNKAKMKLW